jgi:hypothetical protein
MKNYYTKFTATLITTLFICSISFAQFSSGGIVVLQVGDGVATLANTGNALILKEYSPLGVLGVSLNVPSTGTNALILGGTATSEGALMLTPNKKYLVFGGYAQVLPNATPLSGATAATINRGVGIVDIAASYTRVATSTSFYSANNIRSAASDGLNNYWAAGGNDGTNYFGIANPTVNIQNGNTNTRVVNIFNGNLYFSTGSGTTGIYQVGTGLPTTSGQTNTQVINTTGIGTGGPSPFGFYFNPGQTVCYVADDRSSANGGGVQKWIFSGSWTYTYTIPTGIGGARGVIVDFSGVNPQIYATTTEVSANRLVAISDVGPSSTATTIATATTGAVFRGVAFAPCTNPTITAVTANTLLCSNQTLTLNVTGTGSSPFTYSWTGAGTFSSNTIQTPSVTNVATGSYSINLSNSCGSTTAAISVSVNAAPSITATTSSSLICSGESSTLSVSGATSYTWSTNSNSATIVVSPTVTTTYTVSSSNAQGCIATSTIIQNVSPCTSIKEQTLNSSVNIFPNPANEFLNVKLESGNQINLIEIYNSLGQLVYTIKIDGSETQIKTNNFAKGVYTLKVNSGNSQLFNKFIKE